MAHVKRNVRSLSYNMIDAGRAIITKNRVIWPIHTINSINQNLRSERFILI